MISKRLLLVLIWPKVLENSELIFLPINTLVKFFVFTKTYLPIEVIESDKLILVKEEQPINAWLWIEVIESGKLILVKEEQPSNAASPMVVTLRSIVTVSNLLQL